MIISGLADRTGLFANRINLSKLEVSACILVGVGLLWLGFAPAFDLLWPGVLAVSIGITVFYPVVITLGIFLRQFTGGCSGDYQPQTVIDDQRKSEELAIYCRN